MVLWTGLFLILFIGSKGKSKVRKHATRNINTYCTHLKLQTAVGTERMERGGVSISDQKDIFKSSLHWLIYIVKTAWQQKGRNLTWNRKAKKFFKY